jgi:hypothetical protein
MGPNHEQEFAVLESQEQNLWCGIDHWPFDCVPALMRENYRSHEWNLMILIRASDYVHAANTIKLFHQRASLVRALQHPRGEALHPWNL